MSHDTGLDMRVVQVNLESFELIVLYSNKFYQVWFQNRRAKEKRLKKDANSGQLGKTGQSLSCSNSVNHTSSPSKLNSKLNQSISCLVISVVNETSTSCSSWFEDPILDSSEEDSLISSQPY